MLCLSCFLGLGPQTGHNNISLSSSLTTVPSVLQFTQRVREWTTKMADRFTSQPLYLHVIDEGLVPQVRKEASFNES